MNRVWKRYLATLVITIVAVFAIMALAVQLIERADTPEMGYLAGIMIVGTFGIAAALVAREKGRSYGWALAAFIAPLLPIVLLLPHTKKRRAQLLNEPSVPQGSSVHA
jgi:hypothetical protein